MAKIELPPLTPEEILERDHEEYRLNKEISKCWRGDDFDAERANKVLRAFAVVIFEIIFSIYRKKGFQPGWLASVVTESVHRVLVVYSSHNVYRMPSLNEIEVTLRTTIMLHVRGDSSLMIATGLSKIINKGDSVVAEAGGDIVPPSLPDKMASMQDVQPSGGQDQRNSREAFVFPLLEKKGWSVFEWATESGVAFHTADDYLKGKRNQYRSTIKKLAESLGLSVHELPH